MKKLVVLFGMAMLCAALFTSCGDKSEPSGSNPLPVSIDTSDITSPTEDTALSDGKWKFIDTKFGAFAGTECGTFIVSDSCTKLTYVEAWDYSDGILTKYDANIISGMNSGPDSTNLNTRSHRFYYDSDAASNNWELLTNNDAAHKKYSIKKVDTRTILLEKIQ